MTPSPALARFGDCFACGLNVAFHRDDENKTVNCGQAARNREEFLQTLYTPTQQPIRAFHVIDGGRDVLGEDGLR